MIVSTAATAHGGGLNADGCHTNRKKGDYHCHGSPRTPAPAVTPPSTATYYANCAAARAAGAAPGAAIFFLENCIMRASRLRGWFCAPVSAVERGLRSSRPGKTSRQSPASKRDRLHKAASGTSPKAVYTSVYFAIKITKSL